MTRSAVVVLAFALVLSTPSRAPAQVARPVAVTAPQDRATPGAGAGRLRRPPDRVATGVLLGGVIGGFVGYVWVKSRSHENRELDFIPVMYGAALGAVVGLVVGLFSSG